MRVASHRAALSDEQMKLLQFKKFRGEEKQECPVCEKKVRFMDKHISKTHGDVVKKFLETEAHVNQQQEAE